MNTETKYPKFREKLSNLNESELRDYARQSVNAFTHRLCCLDLDELPDTAELCEGIDCLEETLLEFKKNPSFTDESIKDYKVTARDLALSVLSEEGYVAGENPWQ